MDRGKAYLAVTDAFNGDIDSVDPAVRRAVFAVATQHDVDRAENQLRHDANEKHLRQIKVGVYSMASTLLMILATAVINSFF